MTENESLKLKEVESLDRIASALEEIAEYADVLNKCIAYYPPRNHMKEGFYFLRIGGQVYTE